jgi:hypothetical protein
VRIALAAWIATGAGICAAQSSATVSLSNGVQVRVSASLGNPPAGAQSVKIQLGRASGNSFYRIFRDQNDLAVFAYELSVERSEDGEQILITAKPVETEFAARFPNADGGKPVPTLSSEQTLPGLNSGDSGEIGLFELEGQGLKVIDTVQARLNQGGAAATRDASAVTSQERLRFSDLSVSIDGTPVPGSGEVAVSGRYAMFYIPGRGGYFFSTENPPGRTFTKAASVDRNRLRFVLNNEMYDCVADAPVLVGFDSGELWVYHDPAYEPAGNWTKTLPDPQSGGEFFTAASDSLNWWLP